MTRLSTLLLLPTLFTCLTAQEPAGPSAAATQQPSTPSAVLKPAIDSIQQTLVLLRPERWKLSGTVSQETQANLTSIQADLQTTLPPLLAVADQHPDSIAQVLPVFRNVSALYDVLLRVTQVASLTAPGQQSAALQQTIATLETSRRSLGDTLQSSALTQNQQIHDLQAQLQTAQVSPTPAPAACPPQATPAPAKKHKPKPKPALAPTTSPGIPAPTNPPAN